MEKHPLPDPSVPRARGKRFVLMFDDLESIHLFKDVGQVPFQMYRHFGYDAEIVCRRHEEEYLYIDDALKGLKLTFYEGSPYRYLLDHAREIDILMLFHISTLSIYRGLLYKLVNPRGCLYIKADMNGEKIRYAEWGERNFLTQAKRVFLFKQLVKRVDIVSVETELSFCGVNNIPREKMLLLSNGFDPDFIDWYGVRRRTFDEKENIILLVGRHGDYAKNTELMLDTLADMGDIGDWQVWFVGPMTAEFEKRRAEFQKQYPHLIDKVVFTGQIDDKKELLELYSRAKILCLTSRWESWGMVCVEAMAFGCVPVMTPVSSASDLTGKGHNGVVIDSYEARDWAAGLQELADSPVKLEKYSLAVDERFQNSFNWQKIVSRLDERIRQHYGK
jgi:glycosyltransferase involved in cell wall biosynthesis